MRIESECSPVVPVVPVVPDALTFEKNSYVSRQRVILGQLAFRVVHKLRHACVNLKNSRQFSLNVHMTTEGSSINDVNILRGGVDDFMTNGLKALLQKWDDGVTNCSKIRNGIY